MANFPPVSTSILAAAVTSASNQAALAAASLVTIKNAYYGALAAAPTVRPDGSARQVGDRYYNTATGAENTWNGSAWYVPNIDSSALALANGAEKIGRYGQNLSVSLQNRTGGAALKKFIQKLMYNSNDRRINVRLVGTSISQGDSASSIFAQALTSYFGTSNSGIGMFASQAEQPISGWKTQYYSGVYSIRLRGGNGDTATPITYQVIGKSFTVFYGTETDGGNIGVTIQSANGAVVAQAAINCNGATSINNAVTYTLNPDFVSTIVFTPPASGFGYLEYSATDAGDYGMMFSNLSYGGSSLWNHVGTPNAQGISARAATTGMYPSATPSGNKGLIATFAPTDASVKPDLLIYSGPTNDAGDSVNYAANLLAAVTLSVANGSSCILVIEPINGSTSRSVWDVCRAAYYSAASAFPDSIFVYDFDALISSDLVYNTKFHSSTSDPHPGDYGYGSPHTAAGNDLCARLGVPFQKKLGRVPDIELSRAYTQANEPMQSAIGSTWYDTSNTTNTGIVGVRKKLISRKKGKGSRGLWSCETGENISLYDQSFLTSANSNFSSMTQGFNFLGDACIILTGQSGFPLDKIKFVAGQTYTFSYCFEAPAYTSFNTLLSIGANPFFTAKAKKQAFLSSANDNVSDVISTAGAGDVGRYVCTFKWPTQAEFDAATAAGINVTGNLQFTIQGGTVANPVSVWNFRVESGASMTNGTIAQLYINQAISYQLSAVVSTIEPLPTVVAVGNSWNDTSNGSNVSKRLVQSSVLTNIAANSPGVFSTGNSLWRGPAAAVNLLDQFTTNATLTPTAGTTAVKGSYGPGGMPGIRWDTTTGNGNVNLDILSAIGTVNLTPNAIYTLSFLGRFGRGDNIIDNVNAMSLFTNLREFNNGGSNLQLQTDLVTWSGSSGAWKITGAPKDQQYRRFKLTFKAYGTAPGSNASNYFTLMLLSQNFANQWAELSEFRLELGASVTAD